MTHKYSPILWWPPKNIRKIFIPQKIFIFLKPPKNNEIQNFEPKKMTRAYLWMKISKYPPAKCCNVHLLRPINWDQSSLLLFHKIHYGAVSFDKDNNMPLITVWTCSAQYCRYQTNSNALKNSFAQWTILHRNSLSPSVAITQTRV